MPAHLLFLARNFLYWIFFFEFARLVFLIYHHNHASASVSSAMAAFFHGLRLDAAASCYILAVPFLLWSIQLISGWNTLRISAIYNYTVLTVAGLIHTADLQLYKEWGSKIGPLALFYLKYPKEALASSASSPILLLLSIFLIQVILGAFVCRRFVGTGPLPVVAGTYRNIFKKTSSILVAVFLLITGMRGGLQLAPVNQSSAYFSNIPFFNHAALNTVWNLIDSSLKGGIDRENPYRITDQKQAEKIVSELRADPGKDIEKILTVSRPNIVLIIMESFSADVIESLGGEKGVCRGFEELKKEGILFTDFYASGDRTDKGIVAILSGFPSQPVNSIIKDPGKFEKLPVISRPLRNAGYKPWFFYGGESEFVNIKAYLLHGGYEQIIDRHDFRKEDMNSKWGAHDHVLFGRVTKELKIASQPFFATVLTLSNHEPFEVPGPQAFQVKGEGDLYRNSASYTDRTIKDFVDRNRTEPWFRNTLFILVADHGHRLPKNYPDLTHPGKFRIPLLLFGEVVKPELRGRQVGSTGSQTDLAVTLLNQLDLPSAEFAWGNDLFSRSRKGFAFYSFNDGFGWMQPSGRFIFDNGIKKVTYSDPLQKIPEEELFRARCYLQALMDKYLAY